MMMIKPLKCNVYHPYEYNMLHNASEKVSEDNVGTATKWPASLTTKQKRFRYINKWINKINKMINDRWRRSEMNGRIGELECGTTKKMIISRKLNIETDVFEESYLNLLKK